MHKFIGELVAGEKIIRKTTGGRAYVAVVLSVEHNAPNSNPAIRMPITRVHFSPVGQNIIADFSGPAHLKIECVTALLISAQ